MLFSAKPALGLDISDSSIEAVYIAKKGDRPILSSYGRIVLPPGLIVDGQVIKLAELAVILRKLLADEMTPPLPSGAKRVVFALPESKVYSHVFEVPRVVEESELAKALAVEADGYFPYSHGEMVSGLAVIDEQPNSKQVYFAAVQRDALAQYLELFQQCGLEVAVVEGEATSMARAVFRQDEPEAAVLADIGARVTTLSIFDHHGIQFSETLTLAGDAFTAAIAEALKIPLEQAEDLKRLKGLGDEIPIAAAQALTIKVDELVANIERAVEFYETRSKRQVKRAYFCGGSVLLPGLFEYATDKLAGRERPIESRITEPLRDLDIDPALVAVGINGHDVLLPTAIGLGLRGAGIRKFSEIDFLTSAQRIVARENHGSRSKPLEFPAASAKLPGAKSTRASVMFHWSGWPKPAKVGLIVLAVLAIAGLAWAAAFLVVPRISSLFGAAKPPVAVAPKSIDVSLDFKVGPEALAPDMLKASYPSASVEKSRNFQREGTKVEGKSRGQIVIHNDGAVAQTLIPTTRLVSEGGITFRLDNRATIRAHGTATVAVTADQPGVAGDVAPGRWIIPGLAVAQQARVYGVSDATMQGGLTLSAGPVTQAEIDQATAILTASTDAELRRQVADLAGSGFQYLDSTFHVTKTTVVSGPTVGASVSSYDLSLKVEASAATYSVTDLSQLVATAAQASAGPTAVLGTIGALTPVVTSSDPVAGTASLHLTTSVSLK